MNFVRRFLKKINFDEILYTDESKINMGSYPHDFIRLSPDLRKNSKMEIEVYIHLTNRPEHKFEGSVIIAGGFIL